MHNKISTLFRYTFFSRTMQSYLTNSKIFYMTLFSKPKTRAPLNRRVSALGLIAFRSCDGLASACFTHMSVCSQCATTKYDLHYLLFLHTMGCVCAVDSGASHMWFKQKQCFIFVLNTMTIFSKCTWTTTTKK